MENVYRSFYTKSDYITKYMVNMLELEPNDLVLEPSGGDGVFIDSLLEVNHNLKIETCDLNAEAVNKLNEKYRDNDNIKIWETDTLLDEKFDTYALNGGYYDKVIGNPPYGGWQDFEKRELLKKKYNGHYVKETYSLFLLRCISLLKKDGILSFIIPDTFLYLHRHTALREYLLTNTKIKEILIFPSKFFPGVNFGYSNLSIITVQKANKEEALNNNIRVIKGFTKEEELDNIRLDKNLDNLIIKELNQGEIFKTEDYSFFLNEDDRISKLINTIELKLGDISDCVTGIYTGNNTKYIKVKSKDLRGAKNYEIVEESQIDFNYKSLEGINTEKCYIPIVKGSSKDRYIRNNIDWYIDWSKDAIYHYNNDKKARFQNSQFYFRIGIGLPMVKASQIRATLIENMVFDQSIVGVFPKEEKYLYYLLGLLNSDIIRDITHTINPTANSSANYVKRIPIILPDKEILNDITNQVKEIIEDIKNNKDINKKHKKLNLIFKDLYLQEVGL